MSKRVDNKFDVKILKEILEDFEISGLDTIGVELLERHSCERLCYDANDVRIDDERKALVITIEVNES